MVTRLSFRRHVSWNTRSNKNRLVKTPGGRVTYLVARKKVNAPKCGDTKKRLQGMPQARPAEMRRLKQRQRKVARAYGGTLSARAVRTRIVRAFLIEEQRCVKAVLLAKEREQRKEEEAAAKKAAKKSKAKK